MWIVPFISILTLYPFVSCGKKGRKIAASKSAKIRDYCVCSYTISTKLLLFVQNLLLVVDKNCCLLYTLFSCQKCEQVKKHETFCGCCEIHSVGNMQPQVSIVWFNRNMSFGPPWRSFNSSKACENIISNGHPPVVWYYLRENTFKS